MTDLNDLLVTSPDLNKERLETLKRLFPDLFTNEGKLNPVELRRLFEDEATTDKEHYAFTWKGKGKAKRHAFTPSRASLTYDPERSVNPDKANGNLIIEGENLEVLKLLTSAYREKIKCIYIDPPYNTGGDFIYPDNYTQSRKEYWEENGAYKDGVKLDTNTEAGGRYHSDWLSMMYSRLLIARQLLRDDGVIFISIDDNEVHNLCKIMDDVFGEEGFVALITAMTNPRGRTLDRHLAKTHEYIAVYAKNPESNAVSQIPKSEKAKAAYNGSDEKGDYRLLELRNRNPVFNRQNRPNLFYPIYVDPNTNNVSLVKDDIFTVEVLPVNSRGEDGCWTWGTTKVKRHIDLLVGKLVNTGAWRIYRKDYLKGTSLTTKAKSTWLESKINHEYGKELLGEIFGKTPFDFPKSIHLIKACLQLGADDPNAIVLDFFAGSGTTAHATMDLNQEDGGNRQFILIQLPEAIDKGHEAYKAGYRTISQITIERNKRVIEGYGDDPQPLDTGFKVYRLTKSHFPRAEFQPDPDKSNEENIELLKKYIAEKEASFHMAFEQGQVFDEVLLKNGFKLDYKLTKQEEFEKNMVYMVEEGDRKAYVCLDTTIANETIDFFKTHKDTMFICLERALDTTKKWNLSHTLGERLKAL
jgi:adenine-specific DNA-methyltransferase